MRRPAVHQPARDIFSGWPNGRSVEGKRSSGNFPSSGMGNEGLISVRVVREGRHSQHSVRRITPDFLIRADQHSYIVPLAVIPLTLAPSFSRYPAFKFQQSGRQALRAPSCEEGPPAGRFTSVAIDS